MTTVEIAEKSQEQTGDHSSESIKDAESLKQADGQLVIIGGAEDKESDCQILREFVRRAGGTEAHIAVMTVATNLPKEVGDNYHRVFENLGVQTIDIVDTDRRDDASSSKALNALKAATGIFFTGGDQARITSILKDTELHHILLDRYKKGIVIAGTSAGASMMSSCMIIEGEAETHPTLSIVKIDEGMNFLPDVVIDQHFSQRGRLGRLLAALANYPDLIGIGIDENTAIIVNDRKIEVIGEGSCTIADPSEMSHTNIKDVLKDENLALCNVKLHILPEGYGFDLDTRKTFKK